MDIITFSIEDTRQQYVDLCDRYGQEPDQHVLDCGRLKFAELQDACTLGDLPSYDYHYHYGDVSMMLDVHDTTIGNVAKTVLGIIYTGDVVTNDGEPAEESGSEESVSRQSQEPGS
jgi:hypothetical protein